MYDECFQYGIGHGCDEYCPVLQRCECEFTYSMKINKILKNINKKSEKN